MRFIDKAWYRSFQMGMNIGSRALYWRKPILVSGEGSSKNIAPLLKEHDVSRVMVVTGRHVGKSLAPAILESLKAAGIEYYHFSEVEANPSTTTVFKIREAYRDNYCNGFLAIGGGSPMDAAKAAAALIVRPDKQIGDMAGLFKVGRRLPPFVAVPTTAGTAAEVTINYVITDEEAKRKMVCVDPNDIPMCAVIDCELMYSMPKGLTAATGMDALTHAVEGYLTPGAWTMSDMFELKAIELIARHLKNAVDDGSDETARAGMAEAQYIAGMGFSNVGLGIVHSMAHPLGAFYDTPHGVANATLLPYVMEYNAESPSRAKYLDIARAMGVKTDGMSVDEGVRAAIDAVKALSLSIRIPQRLHELGVREEDIPALAVAAFNDVCTGGNPRPTSVEEIERLYHIAY